MDEKEFKAVKKFVDSLADDFRSVKKELLDEIDDVAASTAAARYVQVDRCMTLMYERLKGEENE